VPLIFPGDSHVLEEATSHNAWIFSYTETKENLRTFMLDLCRQANQFQTEELAKQIRMVAGQQPRISFPLSQF
jgi:hypothetical protein